ncbi:hypothetical protein FRA_24c01380 [Francisella sp. W12-1067]|nr:hypothetical protein FRA_24c01380 [Francisella sp. W12-1067]
MNLILDLADVVSKVKPSDSFIDNTFLRKSSEYVIATNNE